MLALGRETEANGVRPTVMALNNDSRDFAAQIALSRFGLGPRAGDVKRVSSDPRGAVEAEIKLRGAGTFKDPYLISSSDAMRNFYMRRAVGRLKNGREQSGVIKRAIETMREKGMLPADAETAPKRVAKREEGMDGGGMTAPRGATNAKNYPTFPGSPLDDEIAARFVQARKAGVGFDERWAMFWANHFTVSNQTKNFMSWMVGGYEREAIRPNVFGRFSDLLMAATRHAAMLRYLNNNASTGPNSPNGERSGRGLNENHARELLELHTVGVSAGYTQADIIALAKILTGWRIKGDLAEDDYMTFRFIAGVHEPGDQTVMGKVYRDDGLKQGEAALNDLARKPQTAEHLARRIAVAFVSDDPPPALVDRLARTFRDTDGDLKEVAFALVRSDEAWDAPRTKMRSPQEFVLASVRLMDRQPDPDLLIRTLKNLGQPYWGAPSPKGFTLSGRDWIAPDAQTNRLDFAVALAKAHADALDPNAVAADALGDVMSDETRTAVKRAGSRDQAIALLLMSPEMQRR